MGGWWIGRYMEQPDGLVWIISITVWVIGSICLHELAHGWAAIRQGDDTPILLGHMTWNPMVHMGWQGMLAFAFLGIAWGSMPTTPWNFRSKYGRAFVAAAGPAMNLILGIIALAALVIWSHVGASVAPPHIYENLWVFFVVGSSRNFLLMLFNLLPIAPLDGSSILADIFPPYARLLEKPWAPQLNLGLFVVAFLCAGYILGPIVYGFMLFILALFGGGQP